MKPLKFLSVVLMLCYLTIAATLNAQTPSAKSEAATAATTNAEVKEMFFIDRFYQIKDTYPALDECFGPYAASSHTLPKFIERYNQIKAAYPKLKIAHAKYASSNYTLDEFVKRYYAMKDTYPDMAHCYADFAASEHSLTEYIKRYNQAKDADKDKALSEYYSQYAASKYPLSEFTSRYYAVKAVRPDLKNCYGEYAASTKKLTKKD